MAAEGLVVIELSDDDKAAAIVEVNCETDFVAKKEDFQGFASAIARRVLTDNPADLDALMAMPLNDADATTVEEARKALRLDWGDTLEDREALIRGWMDKSEAPEDLRNMLDSRSLPLETMKWLHEVAKQFKGEVNPISKDREATKVVIDPAEAREKIATTLQDMTNMSPADPRYQDLQRKLIEYHRLANAGQAA